MKLGILATSLLGTSQTIIPLNYQLQEKKVGDNISILKGTWISKLQTSHFILPSSIPEIKTQKTIFENQKYKIQFNGNIDKIKFYSIYIKTINKYYVFMNDSYTFNMDDPSENLIFSRLLINKFESDNLFHRNVDNQNLIFTTKNNIDKINLYGDTSQSFSSSWGVYNEHSSKLNLDLNLEKNNFTPIKDNIYKTNLKININNIQILFFQDLIDPPISHSSIKLNTDSSDLLEYFAQSEKVQLGESARNGEEWWHGFLDAIELAGLGRDVPGLIAKIFNEYASFNENHNQGMRNLINLMNKKSDNFIPIEKFYKDCLTFNWNVGAKATSLMGNKSQVSILGLSLKIDYDLKWDEYSY